ncbi:MAG: glucose-6-phosphate isomerase [Bacilli bacterium]|nr:glucose-6-phosphate isomerase [Bacilli bacterium]
MINFDFHKYIGNYVKKEDKVEYLEKAREIKSRFIEGDLKYWNKLESFISSQELKKIVNMTDYIRSNCNVFLVIGIGGSYMGSKAVIEALSPMYDRNGPEILFLGTNLCSEEYFETLEYLKDKEIILNVISKSGKTLETSIAFSLVMDLMKEKYTEEELKDRIIITTDPEKGDLRELANLKDYVSFTIPELIGGRFSCLTPVGLLPIAVSGINIIKLIEGARISYERVDRAIEYAVIRDIMYKKGKTVEAFTVYNPKLYYFTEWLKQLFAETQGKNKKGILPISCVNTRDLHSLGQFLQDGHDIIFETVIGIDKDKMVTLDQYDMELNSLNKIALDKVGLAHSNGNTPTNIITIDEKNEETIGELIHFFILVSIVGALLIDVNPFDQPGVEEYKKLINEELE